MTEQTMNNNTYKARVDEKDNGITHGILTWDPQAVLKFLATYHIPGTKIDFVLYPLGAPARLIGSEDRMYELLQEDAAINERAKAAGLI